jgi:hypothetical protein
MNDGIIGAPLASTEAPSEPTESADDFIGGLIDAPA